jgi:DNA-binding phage protein
MTRTNISTLPEFEARNFLDDEQAIAAYLTDVLAADNPELLNAALADVCQAKAGMDIVNKICAALGLQLPSAVTQNTPDTSS